MTVRQILISNFKPERVVNAMNEIFSRANHVFTVVSNTLHRVSPGKRWQNSNDVMYSVSRHRTAKRRRRVLLLSMRRPCRRHTLELFRFRPQT